MSAAESWQRPGVCRNHPEGDADCSVCRRVAAAAARRRRVMEMRDEHGLMFREIGARLGVSTERARCLYRSGLERRARMTPAVLDDMIATLTELREAVRAGTSPRAVVVLGVGKRVTMAVKFLGDEEPRRFVGREERQRFLCDAYVAACVYSGAL